MDSSTALEGEGVDAKQPCLLTEHQEECGGNMKGKLGRLFRPINVSHYSSDLQLAAVSTNTLAMPFHNLIVEETISVSELTKLLNSGGWPCSPMRPSAIS